MDKLENLLDNSRIILVNGYIDSAKATEVIFKLLRFSQEKEDEDIQLYISASGGSYLDVMAIYDTLNVIKTPVSGICIGAISDYAALLLASCTKGKRYALNHSEISLNQPYGFLGAGVNQQTQIAIEAQQITMEREMFEKTLASLTGKTYKQIHSDCEFGIDLKATDAKKYGIIDEIIG